MMNYFEYLHKNIETRVAAFEVENGTSEYHLMLKPVTNDDFENTLKNINDALNYTLYQLGAEEDNIIFQRYFSSDLVNQFSNLKALKEKGKAISFIEQPPLPDKKLALWVYLIKDENPFTVSNSVADLVLEKNGYIHYWDTNLSSTKGDSFSQTVEIFSKYKTKISKNNLTLADNLIRTWIFVRNVDNNYNGVVVARRNLFELNNLTSDTHYISSTGIEGRTENTDSLVSMDTYAIKGLKEEQIKFLEAPEFLNPTDEYGVTFERGTSVEYGDRKHIFISGTASINKFGEIVHTGNVSMQTGRALTNIEELLKDAGSSLDDVTNFIVYLRDISDYKLVDSIIKKRFPYKPYVILHAPVCRPGWLIEIECIAIKENENLKYKKF